MAEARWILVVSTLFLLGFGFSVRADKVVRSLSNGGKVVGKLVRNPIRAGSDSSSYHAFYGVPYAQPPKGAHRFLPPQEAPEEGAEVDATDPAYMKACPQLTINRRAGNQILPAIGDEDCLRLTIFAPESFKEGEKLPVMVWLHPGGLVGGSGSPLDHSPDYFYSNADRGSLDIVVVSVNFRLGALGWLNMENQFLPGNVGFRDQVMALKWIQKHVASFGGDSSRVTLYGGRSALVHMISPRSSGLFHKVISSSGPIITPFRNGFPTSKDPVDAALTFVEILGCGNSSLQAQDVLKCLQDVELDRIVEGNKMFETFMLSGNPWNFAVDGQYLGADEAVIPDDPKNMLANGNFQKVPLLIGGNQHEGDVLMPQFVNGNNERLNYLSENLDRLLPHFLLKMDVDDVTEEDVATAGILRVEYLSKGTDSNLTTAGNMVHFRNLLTDVWFLAPLDAQVKLMSKHMQHEPIFYYNYRFKGSLTTSRDLMTTDEAALSSLDWGVGHNDELFLIFKSFREEIEGAKSTEDFEMSKKLVKILKNFVSRSDPDVGNWKPVSGDVVQYAILNDADLVSTREEEFSKRVEFVESILDLGEFFKNMEISQHPAVVERMREAEEGLFDDDGDGESNSEDNTVLGDMMEKFKDVIPSIVSGLTDGEDGGGYDQTIKTEL